MPFFSDNFVDTDGVLLQSHAPNTGTGWTRLFGSTGTNAEIASNQVRSDGDLNAGVLYTADATYPSADYDMTCTMVSMVGNNDRPIWLFVRIADQENMYAVRLETTASESSLYKKVAGTWTAIGSLFTKPANGSVIKLEIIGTALKFYDDGVVIASATVTDLASAGKAGIGFGGHAELLNTTDDGSTSNVLDTLTLNDLGTSNVVITCGVGALGLNEHAAMVVPGAKAIICGVGALNLSEHNAAVVSAVSITCTVGALNLNEHGVSVLPGAVTVACATAALNLNEHRVSVLPGAVSIACASGALNLNEHVGHVLPGGVTISLQVGALSLAEHQATVLPGAVNISCAVGTLALAEYQADAIPGGVTISCVYENLAFAGWDAFIGEQVTVTRMIEVDAIVITSVSVQSPVYGNVSVNSTVRELISVDAQEDVL